MVATFKNAPGVSRDIPIVRTGFKLNGEASAVATPPPLLGEHTRDILADLGYSDHDIEGMVEEKGYERSGKRPSRR